MYADRCITVIQILFTSKTRFITHNVTVNFDEYELQLMQKTKYD